MIGPTNASKTGGTVGTDLKPIKLVNGVPTAVTNDLVDTASQQNIGGNKTFTGNIYSQGAIVVGDSTHNGNIEIYHSTPFIDFHYGKSSSDYTTRMIESNAGLFQIATTDGTNNASLRLFGNSSDAHVSATYRSYASASSADGLSDVITKAHLESAITIGGAKTFSDLTKTTSSTQAQSTGQFRNVYTSQGPPSDTIGADGEIWVQADPDLGTSSGGSNVVTVSAPSIYRGTYSLGDLGLTDSSTIAERCAALGTKLPNNNEGDSAYITVNNGTAYEKYVWHAAWTYDSSSEIPPMYVFGTSPRMSVGSDSTPVKILNGMPVAVSDPFVTQTGDPQSISSAKTYTQTGTYDVGYGGTAISIKGLSASGSMSVGASVVFKTSGNDDVMKMYAITQSNNQKFYMNFTNPHASTSGKSGSLKFIHDTTNDKVYLTAPARAYANAYGGSQSGSDIITKWHLEQNISIGGNKTFTGTVAVTAPAPSSSLVRNITISSSSPSGGSNGDVWLIPGDSTLAGNMAARTLTSVSTSDTSYTGYPYKYSLEVVGALSTMTPWVTFGPDVAKTGNFAPVVESATDKIYLWARTAVSSTVAFSYTLI